MGKQGKQKFQEILLERVQHPNEKVGVGVVQ
jgi:hypothetical protein